MNVFLNPKAYELVQLVAFIINIKRTMFHVHLPITTFRLVMAGSATSALNFFMLSLKRVISLFSLSTSIQRELADSATSPFGVCRGPLLGRFQTLTLTTFRSEKFPEFDEGWLRTSRGY